MLENNIKYSNLKVIKIFKESISLMNKFNIPPTPENYTVFYNFIEQKERNLFEELKKAIECNNVNDFLINSLYEKYFFNPKNKKLENIINHTCDTIIDTENNLENLKDIYIATENKIKNCFDKNDSKNFFKELFLIIKNIINQHKITISLLKESNKKIKRLKKEINKLKYESYLDSLTEIFNRRKLFIDLKEKIQNYKRYKDIYIIMADIDNFKNINDNFNHRVGDAVLKYVAQKISNFITEDDIFARYGGEEFTIIFTKIKSDDIAIKRIKKIKQAVSEKILKVIGTNEKIGQITLSYGMIKYTKNLEADKAIENADVLLYKAKKSGKDRIVFLDKQGKELTIQ